jgi:alpha-beta hydrolase superfamily lysophospholipase
VHLHALPVSLGHLARNLLIEQEMVFQMLRQRVFRTAALAGLSLGFILLMGPHWGHVDALQTVQESSLAGACHETRFQHLHPTVDRNRPLVVLLHGLTNCPWEMGDLSQALFEAGFDVMTPRMPGHGTSSTDLETVSWPDVLAFEARVIAAAHARSNRVFMLGTSFGGIVGLHGAMMFPGMVRGVILLSPFLSSTYDSVLTVACAGAQAQSMLRSIPGGGVGQDVIDRMRFLPNGASALSSRPERRFWYTETPLRTVCLGTEIASAIQAGLRRFSSPMLLFTSDDDEVVNSPAVRDILNEAPSLTSVWYHAGEGVRHQMAPRNLRVNPRWDSMRDDILRFIESQR